jgi:hypothetical protein
MILWKASQVQHSLTKSNPSDSKSTFGTDALIISVGAIP